MKKNDSPIAIKREQYKPPTYFVKSVELTVVLGETSVQVTNTMCLKKNSAITEDELVLDGVDLELVSLSVDGVVSNADSYELNDDNIVLYGLPSNCSVQIVSRIYPEKNTALEGLYRSSGNYCTQCEAQGFRKITWYLDRPDVLSIFHVRIEGDMTTCPVMLSNGNRVKEGKLENGRHFVEWHDPHPKPCYLFALVAGNLESLTASFVTCSERTVELIVYVEKHNLDKCAYAMRSLKESMRWDEEVYGLEYDLDVFMIVAVDNFNMGAMENKGLNIFNSKYVLADQATATDSDFMGVESVIAHEYFHNWTGNRVTCRDWFQLSLKEGLTVFRDQQFSADLNSRAVKRIEDVRLLRAHQFPEDAGPMAHPIRPDEYIEINNFYTVTVYEKGAEVIRMMHTLLGPEKFRQGMDLYFDRFDGQAVTCDDFVQAMEDASGIALTQFRRWYSQAGTPVLDITDAYDAKAEKYTIRIRQSCPDTPGQTAKLPFHVPFGVGLFNPDSGESISASIAQSAGTCEIDSEALVYGITDAETALVFKGVPIKPIPSLLRNFSAPVIVNFDYSNQDLAFLLANDTDSFNRWDAGQRLYCNVIEVLAENSELSADDAQFDGFHQAFEALLTDTSIDPAFAAEAISLPDIETVATGHDLIQVDALDDAITRLKYSLASRNLTAISSILDRGCEHEEFSVSADSIGRRRLRNVTLALLGAASPELWLERVVSQYYDANNMTDRIAALQIVCHSDVSERIEILDDFYRHWSSERLVIDKWFSLQARSKRKNVTAEVRGLTEHHAFELSNPNRVRSLIGAFAMSNTVGFHSADGQGYQLVADYVLKLDQLNPQIAARLVGPLGRWRRFDENRQSLMKDELNRIHEIAALSPDVYEIVSKSLE